VSLTQNDSPQSVRFSAAISGKNNRSFDWFVNGEKKNWGEARRKARLCRMLLYEIKLLVEAAGVEPASENVTGQENYMLSRVHALGITPGRSRRALRTDKKRVPLACDLSLAPQT